ncbi:MAG: RNA polymerase sigma factor [Erysipelotrichaceae bacterium]|nr:RNA polymerase sigma factor [Erysipelotrichaceae bacterium]
MQFDQKHTEALIQRIRHQDETAFRDFYEEWYPKAYYIALAITHHEADAKDVAQETMIEIHRSLEHLRDLNYFKLWFNRIILSKCNRIFRKKKAVTMDVEQHNTLYEQREERSDFLPLDHIHKENDIVVLRHMLGRLQPIYAEVLVLMYLEQCSIKEIAAILQVPEGTVKSRLSSAKGKLKSEIHAYEQREQVKLSFHGRSLEGLLVAAYANMSGNVFGSMNGMLLQGKQWISHITSHVAICACGIVLGGSILLGGVRFYQAYQPKHDANSLREFAPVTFMDLEIHNEKEAYFALMKYAHCEVELNQLNEGDLEIAENLMRQLHYPESVYDMLWRGR